MNSYINQSVYLFNDKKQTILLSNSNTFTNNTLNNYSYTSNTLNINIGSNIIAKKYV